jgi:hypothetical protein
VLWPDRAPLPPTGDALLQPPVRPPLSPRIKAQFAAYRAAHDARPVHDDGLLSLVDVVDRIGRALAERRPFSLVRLGDGEGGCLFWGHPDFPELAHYVATQSMESHFGPQDWLADDIAGLRDGIADAAVNADIVTFARKAAVRARLMAAVQTEARGHVGATYADHWLSDRRSVLRGAVYQDGYLHAALLPRYPDLLRGQDIVVLGSRNEAFAARLAKAFGARLAGVVTIPGQWSNGAQGAVRLYPHALAGVQARVRDVSGPGRVLLIGAGLCAKALCAQAAAQGAVALDVGSVMDVWAGHGVRGYQNAALVDRYRV